MSSSRCAVAGNLIFIWPQPRRILVSVSCDSPNRARPMAAFVSHRHRLCGLALALSAASSPPDHITPRIHASLAMDERAAGPSSLGIAREDLNLRRQAAFDHQSYIARRAALLQKCKAREITPRTLRKNESFCSENAVSRTTTVNKGRLSANNYS